MTQTDSKTLTQLQQERRQADLRAYAATLRELAAKAALALARQPLRMLVHERAFPTRCQTVAAELAGASGPALFDHAEKLRLSEADVVADLSIIVAHEALVAATPAKRLPKLEKRVEVTLAEHNKWNADDGKLARGIAKLRKEAGDASDAYDHADGERLRFEEAAEALVVLRSKHPALLQPETNPDE